MGRTRPTIAIVALLGVNSCVTPIARTGDSHLLLSTDFDRVLALKGEASAAMLEIKISVRELCLRTAFVFVKEDVPIVSTGYLQKLKLLHPACGARNEFK